MSEEALTGLGPGICLAPARGIHLAVDHGEIVVLDVFRDTYSALGPRTSAAVRWAASPRALPEPHDAAHHLQRLLDDGLLVTAPAARMAGLPEPAEPGGVAICRWTPHLSRAAHTGPRASARQQARAVAAIAGADSAGHRGRTAGLLAWLMHRRAQFRPSRRTDDPATAPRLVDAHIRARMLYPRRIECLIGSAALAAHAWRAGIAATFVIGVQKYPFVAHSWVEYEGQVLNDRTEVSRRLAHILRLAAPLGDEA